jgi:hypothetical protein
MIRFLNRARIAADRDAFRTTSRNTSNLHLEFISLISRGGIRGRKPGTCWWATVSRESYFLEFKNSLTEGTRTTLPAVAGDGTIGTLVDPSATGPRMRLE